MLTGNSEPVGCTDYQILSRVKPVLYSTTDQTYSLVVEYKNKLFH